MQHSYSSKNSSLLVILHISAVLACARSTSERGYMQISPAYGTLQPRARQTVDVIFTSETVKVYSGYAAVMDVVGVGAALLSLPIRGECVVPHIAIEPRTFDFGPAFLRRDPYF
jgi:hypothetical protein